MRRLIKRFEKKRNNFDANRIILSLINRYRDDCKLLCPRSALGV